jgi:GTPase SAR1 family protein
MHFCSDVPFILVGTKCDMRNDPAELEKLRQQGQSTITTEQGNELARKLKAIKYIECSAKTQENLKDVFDEVSQFILILYLICVRPFVLT